MGTKYLDHGVYGQGSFAGYISNTANNDNGVAGQILTVTSVASGIVNIGTCITGAAFGTVITGFTSGTQGGVGVYTVQVAPGNNVTQILRQTAAGALTGLGANPLNSPPSGRWGLPQEGDGAAKTASTASATVSIGLSAATAAAGATVIIMGATLTCVASGAGVNQFNAGSGATLVANLVTAINRTTNTSTVTAQAAGWTTPKVQDAVFARIGSPTTTLQIMTRAGSAQYNSSQVVTSGLTGGTFGPYTFSGGVSGCWGYLTNMVSAVFPSAIGISNYGPCQNTHIAGFVGSAGLGGETVQTRAGKNIFGFNSTAVLTNASTGSIQEPIRFVIDDGTEWPADGSTPQLVFLFYPQATSGQNSISFTNSNAIQLIAKAYSNGTYGVKIFGPPSTGSTFTIGIAVNNGGWVEGVEVDCVTYAFSGASLIASFASTSVYGVGATFKNCLLRHKSDVPFISAGTSNCTYEFINITCDGTGMAAPLTRTVNFGGVNSNTAEFIFENLKLLNMPANSKLAAPTDSWGNATATFSNTTWGAVTGKGPFLSAGGYSKNTRYFQGFNSSGNRDFHFDGTSIFYDWDSNAGYPTCNAKLLDGITPWSIKTVLPRVSTAITRSLVGELPRIVKTLPTAALLPEDVRNITLELAIEASLAFTKRDVYIQVTYVQTDGTLRCIDTYDNGAGALTASTATWSSESGGGQVVFNPGAIVHNKYKLQVTTPTAVKAETEVSIYVRFTRSVSNTGNTIFVDPEVSVT